MFRILMLLVVLLTMTACTGSQTANIVDYETVAERVHRDTERARELNLRGVRLIEAGELDEAEKVIKQALTVDVMFGPAHNNLGKLYYQKDQIYLAAWEFQYAARLMPNQAEPRNNLGLVFEAAGRFDEAVTWYNQALDLEDDNATILANLVRARIRRGDGDVQTRQLLSDLVFRDHRSEWVEWAREQLARLKRLPSR